MEITKDTLLKMHRTMVTIRAFEERMVLEVTSRRTFGGAHSSVGQEAVPAGVCAHLTDLDYISSNHRGHGHAIAKGIDPKLMMAELFGRVTGTNKGKGGSMHIAAMEKGMLGAHGVVGSAMPLAVGAALSIKMKGTDQVAVAFFGEGTANQGVVHECMNLAAIWKLPVIFLCENNLYAESTPAEYALAVPNVADRASAYSMPGVMVDGMDVLAVYDAAGELIGRARSGLGPSLLECKTYRFYGHFTGDNPKSYRTEEEEKYWRSRDPIPMFEQRMINERRLSLKEMERVKHEADALMDGAVKFAEESPLPSPEELYSDVYVDYPLEALIRYTGMKL